MSVSIIVIGASAGGMETIKKILSELPKNFSIPIVVVLHLMSGKESEIVKLLQNNCKIEIVEATINSKIEKGMAIFAPPNYHILIEKNGSYSLSTESKINFSRPSIDILFETAADAFGSEVVGIVLSGASSDGSKGLLEIKNKGGTCIVQDPKTAVFDTMPKKAIESVEVDYILSPKEIAKYLILTNTLR